MPNLLRRALPLSMLPFTSIYQTLSPSLRILMYHRVVELSRYDQLAVTPARFDDQMAYLAQHARVISLAQAVTELRSGQVLKPGVVITFDDGYRDNLVHALPILQKYRLPATIFVTSTFCEQSQRHPRYRDESGQLHLNWDETRELARAAGITIGSHTQTHPFLSRLGAEQALAEIAGSRDDIAAQLQQPVEFFCYPSGDFSARELALVAEAGYSAAVTVAPGTNRDLSQPFELYRTEITDKDDHLSFKLKLAGAYDPIHWYLHRKRLRHFAAQRQSSRSPLQAME